MASGGGAAATLLSDLCNARVAELRAMAVEEEDDDDDDDDADGGGGGGAIAQELAFAKESLRLRLKRLHRFNTRVLRAWSGLLNVAMVAYDWELCIACSREIIHVYERYYPSTHPLLGLQQYTLGNVLANLGRVDEARPQLERAASVLVVSHGAETPMVRELGRLVAGLGKN